MAETAPVGVYVHWPFCQAKCPYCDFNSHVSASVDMSAWTEAFLREIDRVARELGDRHVRSVFFGGGTPSLMDPALVDAILSELGRRWHFSANVEVTLEANPTSVEASRFAAFRSAGVNRVSVGVQALNDTDLRRLGRLHDVGEALAAVDVAQRTFDRVNMDLIYARQDQGLEEWRAELTRALTLGLDHYALYQLTVEPGTAFGARHEAGGLRGLPSDDLSADLYDVTQELCDARGLPAYEISNHARPGAESSHNMIYWTGGDYVGLGPGAHGRLTIGPDRVATVAESRPDRWLDAVARGCSEARSIVPPEDDAVERLLMGLRINDGVPLDTLSARDARVPDLAALDELTALGLVEVAEGRLKATESGRLVLNAVIAALLPD